MKKTFRTLTGWLLKAALVLFPAACKGPENLTGKETVKREQDYHNFDAAMERLEKADKVAGKESKRDSRKEGKKGGKDE